MAEAMLRLAGPGAEVQFQAEGLPSGKIGRRQVCRVHDLTLRNDIRQQADLAAQHQAGVSRLAATPARGYPAPFVMARRPEGVLQHPQAGTRVGARFRECRSNGRDRAHNWRSL